MRSVWARSPQMRDEGGRRAQVLSDTMLDALLEQVSAPTVPPQQDAAAPSDGTPPHTCRYSCDSRRPLNAKELAESGDATCIARGKGVGKPGEPQTVELNVDGERFRYGVDGA